MLNNLKRGDKVITSGGIIGKINKVNDYIIKSKPKKNDLKIFIIQVINIFFIS